MKKLFSGWRHPLRALAMALAALSLAWGVALTEGLVAAMVGAVLGVVAGELLGRSRARLGVALGGVALFTLVTWLLGRTLTTTEALASMVGPGNTLAAVGVVRFGTLAFALTTGLRTLAVRRPSALALELGFIAAAVTTVFASHREGVIARPLWLSDWAWQEGIDPSHILLVIGAFAVVLLAVLLVAETKSGRAISSLLALAALAILAVLFINVVGAPTPHSESELGLTDAGMGEPPRRNLDAGDGHEPRNGDGGNGNDPNQGDGGGANGGDGGDGSAGGADGSGDGGASAGDGGDSGSGTSAGDGGADGGGGAGQDAGDGGGGSGQDAGDGGGGAGQDAGDGGSGAGRDAGDSGGLPPPLPSDGSIGEAPPPQDGGPPPPPPSEQLNNDDQSPSNSPAPVAVVLLENDYSPPIGAYYFRQQAWSQFNGSRLVPTTRNDVDLDLLDEFPTLEQRVRNVPQRRGRTRVDATVALIAPHANPFALESAVTFAPAPNPNPQRFLRAWHFSSFATSADYREIIRNAPAIPPSWVASDGDAGVDGGTQVPRPSGGIDGGAPEPRPRRPNRHRDAGFDSGATLTDASTDSGARDASDDRTDAARDVAVRRVRRDATGEERYRGTPYDSEETWAYYTAPHPDARFRALAQRILDQQFAAQHVPQRLRGNYFLQAFLIARWADHEFIYHTRSRHAGVPDPTIDFLFGNKTGYCVHFAHSMVYLWRSLGIPSRISTGYHSDESNRRGGSTIMLRGGDAHAWPEVYVDGYGWIVVDVAPERNLDPPGQAPDEDLQRILGEMARQQPPDPTRPPEEQRPPRVKHNYGRDIGYGALFILAGALVSLYLTKLWRRVAPVFASARTMPRVGYRRALDLLAEAGYAREYGETREHFAERVEAVSPTFKKLTEMHLAARLGDPKIDPGTREAFSKVKWKALLGETAGEIARSTKLWRRVLGWIHPASFLDAR
jgi:transglutaminase-like putative cysteine protease